MVDVKKLSSSYHNLLDSIINRLNALAVVKPTGVYLLDFFCSSIQFYALLSPYLCFISFYILIYMFLEMMH